MTVMVSSYEITLNCSYDTLPYMIDVDGDIHTPHLNRVLFRSASDLSDLVVFHDAGQPISKQCTQLSLFIENQSIQLPHDIKKNILHYLQNTAEWSSLDCHGFVERICLHKEDASSMKLYDNRIFYESGVQSIVVDTLGLCVHSQVYLGGGLFLSKGGFTGSLMVGTAAEIEKLRPGAQTYIVSNR